MNAQKWDTISKGISLYINKAELGQKAINSSMSKSKIMIESYFRINNFLA